MHTLIVILIIILVIILLTISLEKYDLLPNGSSCTSYTECANGYCNPDPVSGQLLCTGQCDVETGMPTGCPCTGDYNCDQSAGLYCGLVDNAFRYCRPKVSQDNPCTENSDCQSGLVCAGLPGFPETCRTPLQVKNCQSCWTACSQAGEEEQNLVSCEQNCIHTYGC